MSQNFDEARLARIMDALPEEIHPVELYVLCMIICDKYDVPTQGCVMLALDILMQYAPNSIQTSKEGMH